MRAESFSNESSQVNLSENSNGLETWKVEIETETLALKTETRPEIFGCSAETRPFNPMAYKSIFITINQRIICIDIGNVTMVIFINRVCHITLTQVNKFFLVWTVFNGMSTQLGHYWLHYLWGLLALKCSMVNGTNKPTGFQHYDLNGRILEYFSNAFYCC